MSTIITSTTVSSNQIEETLPPYEFVYDENGYEQVVTDKDLNSESAAASYARRQFLLNGTSKQSITFDTYSRGLELNSIIQIVLPEYRVPVDLTKNRFIVTKIISSMKGAIAMDKLTVKRYD